MVLTCMYSMLSILCLLVVSVKCLEMDGGSSQPPHELELIQCFRRQCSKERTS